MYEYLIPDEDIGDPPEIVCVECGEPCSVVEETFDYAGTHCTNGKAGTHHTGVWVSECCLADYEET
jgi:hypothetical protein